MLSGIDGVKKYTNKAQVKLISQALAASQEEKRLKNEITRFERECEEKIRIKQERELEQLKLKGLEESSDVKQVQEKKPLTFVEEFLIKPIEKKKMKGIIVNRT